MRDFPRWFNTKQDILNALTDYPEQTKEYIVKLLTDRFIWTENNGVFTLIEDPQARLFVLEFTVEEALEITGDVEIIPSCPSPLYSWDEATKAWAIDPNKVADKKAKQIETLTGQYATDKSERMISWISTFINGISTATSLDDIKAKANAFKTKLATLQTDYANKCTEVENG